MASKALSPSRRSMNGTLPVNGQFPDIQQTAQPTAMSLPSVDANKLRARLYSYAPKQAPMNPKALQFRGPTNTQLKKSSVPSAPRVEPLVCFTNKFLSLNYINCVIK